jgi:TolB-like protein
MFFTGSIMMSFVAFRCSFFNKMIFSLFLFIPILLHASLFAQTSGNKLNIAVMSLKAASGISDGEAVLVADRLRGELFNSGRVNVMEREQMSVILSEQGFQQSGACNDDKCMVQAGQLLGVEVIVSGSIGQLGSTFMINLRAVDVRTGRMTASVTKDARDNLDNLVGEIDNVADELLNRITEKPKPEKKKGGVKAGSETSTVITLPSINSVPKGFEVQDKNINRSGVLLQYGFTWGPPVFIVDGKESTIIRHAVDTSKYDDSVDFTNGPKMCIDLLYQIKSGENFVIDLGPSFQWMNMQSVYHYKSSNGASRIEFMYGNVGIRPGINYVKRMFPLKINIGIFGDLGYSWLASKLDSLDYSGNVVKADSVMGLGGGDLTNFAWTIGWGIGAKLGLEYLFSKHAGFHIDFLYNFCRPSFWFMPDAGGNETNKDAHMKLLLEDQGTKNYPTYEITLPMFGFDAGLSWYF